MKVQIGYVVLYLEDTIAGAKFWQENFDFEIKGEVEAGEHKVITIGAKDGQTNFELVPLALMENNPFNINLGIPSICLLTDDLQGTHAQLTKGGAEVTEISDHGGKNSFAIIDGEGNAFAIAQR